MNALEAALLDRSMARLGNTLFNNRQLDQRERENAVRAELERESMGMRRDELGERREERTQAREDLAAHRETMAQIQRETKELQDRHYRLMQSTGLLKTIQDGLKDGTISPEKLKAGLSDNPMLKELGLGVEIFQAPPAKAGFQTAPGHNLKLAEEYLQRATDAQRAGDGPSAERFREYAERLKRSASGSDGPGAYINQPFGENDPTTGKPSGTIHLPISPDEAKRMMTGGMGGREEISPGGMDILEQAILESKTAPIQKEMEAHLKEIRGGDMDYGFFNTKDRPSRVRELQGKMGSATNTPAAAAPADMVQMRDPKGNVVLVPRARVEELKRKGYQ